MGLESLKVWARSKDLARAAYRVTMRPPLNRHFGLGDQIRRAGTSIPANLAEGYALGTRAQLIRCIRISLGSARELMWHLELAADMGLISPQEASELHVLGDTTVSLLVGLLRKLTR